MSRKVTIKDIASRAGVSVATVSFVMNNLAGNSSARYRVSEATTKKILQIADEMNYRPNSAAQTLRSGKTNTIGVIVTDVSNNFFAEIARFIEDTAYRSNYTVFFGSTDENPEKMDRLIDVMIGRQIDGMIVVPCENSAPAIRKIVSANIPLVLLDRTVEGIEADSVTLNNHKASVMAVESLLSKGYKKIEMISYAMNVSNIREREAGYKSALQENGLADRSKVHRIKFSNMRNQMAKTVDDIMKRDVEAVVFATNTLTLEGLRCFRSRSCDFTSGIAIVGFDESTVFELLSPSIPYVKQPVELFGSESVRILLDNIAHRKEQVVSIALTPVFIE